MNIRDQLARDEGRKLWPYRDTRGFWTIGIGHLLGPTVPASMIQGITDAQCDALFDADLANAQDQLDALLPWWAQVDQARRGVLLNMAFNLGAQGLAGFHQFLALVQAGRWEAAGADLRGTLVYRQLPERYERLRQQLVTGIWQ